MRYIVKCICSLRKHAYLPNEESAAHLRPRKVTSTNQTDRSLSSVCKAERVDVQFNSKI